MFNACKCDRSFASEGGFLELLVCLLKHQEWTVSQNALLVTSHFLHDHTKNTLPSFFLIELCSCVKKLMVLAKANDLSILLCEGRALDQCDHSHCGELCPLYVL